MLFLSAKRLAWIFLNNVMLVPLWKIWISNSVYEIGYLKAGKKSCVMILRPHNVSTPPPVYSAAPWLRGCCDGCVELSATYFSGFRAEQGRLCPQNDQREACNIPVVHHVGYWGPGRVRRGKNGQCVCVRAASWRLWEQLIVSTTTFALPVYPMLLILGYLLHFTGHMWPAIIIQIRRQTDTSKLC